MWKGRLIYLFKWNHTRFRGCPYSQLRRSMQRGHRKRSRPDWLRKAHTHKDRNILCLCSNLTTFSGGKLKNYKWGPNHRDFQSHVFPESPSVSLSSRREGSYGSSARVSPPQQMLQKVDAFRGSSLMRNFTPAEIAVNSHLRIFSKKLLLQVSSHPTGSFDPRVPVLV